MRRTVIALLPLLAAAFLSACKQAPKAKAQASPASRDSRPSPPGQTPETMAAFERMVRGEWRMTGDDDSGELDTVQFDTVQFDTWRWGPGRHSIRNTTYGFGADGKPWHELFVAYWHPGEEEIAILSLLPHGWGVSEGDMQLGDETAYASFVLDQHGSRRKLGIDWEFSGADEYRETLTEDGVWKLADWRYVRHDSLSPTEPHAPSEASQLTERLKILEPWFGTTWEKQDHASDDKIDPARATVEWIPYTDAVCVRVFVPRAGGDPMRLLDVYVYDHSGTDRLQLLALDDEGTVIDGTLAPLEDGALRFEGTASSLSGRTETITARIDLESNDILRYRCWLNDGPGQTRRLDGRYKKVESKRSP